MLSYSDLGKNYRNPIVFADYSDPDVIRVGDTFYMTASSFNYTPGLPILVSKDLVNWQLSNYALKNIGQERFKVPRHSEGVWAPSIRYHEGMFYIYYGMPDEGYYVVRTADPLGEWEEPVCILEGKGLIDPCPFWDEDGRAYVIHGYAKSRIGFKSILGIFEMSPDGLRAVSEDHFIFNGNDPEHPAVTIEGPKVYKRNGYYYIWAPAGGVKEGYQVVLRSRNIRGPYEIKTVMDSGSTVINGPHQGGLVDTVNGDEWFVHFQDRGLYGRICHLQPVHWTEDWPVVGAAKKSDTITTGEPVYEYEKPDCTRAEKSDVDSYFPCFGDCEIYRLPGGALHMEGNGLQASDIFPGGRIGLQWQWMGDHREDFVGAVSKNSRVDSEVETDMNNPRGESVQASKNGLRLFCLNPSGDEHPIIWRSANILTQKLIYPVFEATATVDVSGLLDGDRAGVVMTGGQYLTVYVERDKGGLFVCVAESEGNDADKREIFKKRASLKEIIGGNSTRKIQIGAEGKLYGNGIEQYSRFSFRMTFTYKGHEFDSQKLYFQNVKDPMYGKNPSLSIELGIPSGEDSFIFHDLGVSYTPSDHTWVGAKLGIYALSDGSEDREHGYADFVDFVVKEL